MAAILVLSRLSDPSSELHVAEQWYGKTTLDDLLGGPEEAVNEDRLYRPGNRVDVTPVKEIVRSMEERSGLAQRIWVMDRGMVSQANVEWLQESGRRYLFGPSKRELRRSKKELLDQADWQQVLRRCRLDRSGVERQIGRLLERNRRAAQRFEIQVTEESTVPSGLRLAWSLRAEWDEWALASEGCYVLRTNVADWNHDQLWKAYMLLTQAEAAFRIQKSDLALRPIWHQREDRVQAHILFCFLAYVVLLTVEAQPRELRIPARPTWHPTPRKAPDLPPLRPSAVPTFGFSPG